MNCKIFLSIFGILRGKNEKSQNESEIIFRQLKITIDFPYVGRGGVNQHMENSICFVVFIFESFPYSFTIQSHPGNK